MDPETSQWPMGRPWPCGPHLPRRLTGDHSPARWAAQQWIRYLGWLRQQTTAQGGQGHKMTQLLYFLGQESHQERTCSPGHYCSQGIGHFPLPCPQDMPSPWQGQSQPRAAGHVWQVRRQKGAVGVSPGETGKSCVWGPEEQQVTGNLFLVAYNTAGPVNSGQGQGLWAGQKPSGTLPAVGNHLTQFLHVPNRNTEYRNL